VSRSEVLRVLLDDLHVGDLSRRDGRISFAYDDRWRHHPSATPLSLSMPLAATEHPHRVVEPFLWGLLPDSENVLQQWGRRFHVSISHPLGLLANVGQDVPGAMRIVPTGDAAVDGTRNDEVEWLSEADVAERLRNVRRDKAAWLGPGNGARWSLAGAQPKIALLYDGGWGQPSGRLATTHILKPAITDLDDHDLNEHLCLRAANAVGLRSVQTSVVGFEEERAIVVRRYDRARRSDGTWQRVHQEDMCQALGVHPSHKYQSDGGPSASDVVRLLRSAVSPRQAEVDVRTFVDALVFNWLIAAPDAHAKNYSILLQGPEVRLAPLYDIGSAVPYSDSRPDLYLPKLPLAMSIGGAYRIQAITAGAWDRFAADLRLERDWLRERIVTLADAVPDALADAAADPLVAELESPLPKRLVEGVADRARSCAALMKTG
jgi:serine/threonine-protein kinase HipA